MSEQYLPEELVWADGGHASDVVLTSIADGEHAIVPLAARQHVEQCTVCTMHLGNAALLSLHTANELALRAAHERVKRPLPRKAIAVGLLVAAVGLVPSFLDPDVGASRTLVGRIVPLLLHSGLDATSGIVLTYATAITLVALGFALVRFLPQKEASR